MLIYQSEGFLEVEAKDIRRLSRSKSPVSMTDHDGNSYELQAVLCEVGGDGGARCLVSFHAKELKKSLVFAVDGPKGAAWQFGEKFLVDLGFRLEEVRLNLSPAMLEVVLRDVPGLASPDAARRQREDWVVTLAEHQRLVDEDPESPAGKKAALKLGSERRAEERVEKLRAFLVERFAAERDAEERSRVTRQIEELTRRLHEAEKKTREERLLREMSESITAAAEKRIQELEGVLVDVETKAGQEQKQKTQVVNLKKLLKEREEGLETARAELAALQGGQQELAAQAEAARQDSEALACRLKEAETVQTRAAEQLDKARAQLADALKEKKAALAAVKELEVHVKVLEKERKDAGRELARLGKETQAAHDLQVQREELEQALREARDASATLEKRLSAAEARNRELEQQLQQAEAAAQQQASDTGTAELQGQLAQLTAEVEALREEHKRDVSIRKRLEKGAGEDERRIRELEESLAAQGAAESTAVGGDAATEQLDSLRAELNELQVALREEQAERAGLEDELDQAHKMVDSLDKVVRESEKSAGKAAGSAADREKILKLEANVALLKEQLAQERGRLQELIEALALAERNVASQAADAGQKSEPPPPAAAEPPKEGDADAPKPARQLPHELRPAPKKGAFFRPDWDLEGLPCTSAGQVFQAWETVFNVQISLEGYPSQYCMAYLVVLKVDKIKKLYMLFRLKQNKHSLVCVPARTPKNESELKAAVDEGLKFLQSSGFDMEKMPEEYVEGTLGGFFVGA